MSEFKLGYIFTDHCVLQRNKDIAVFGTGTDGVKITVSLAGKSVSGIIENGKFLVYLPKMEASRGLTLTVSSAKEKVELKDISIGEVWLAGGQSNMEYELQNEAEGQRHLKEDAPNVRFFYTPKDAYEGDERTKHFEEARWQLFSEETAKCWSAVGYYFAKELSERLNVTVGVVGCNYGGTSASAWVAREDLQKGSLAVRDYIEAYEERNKDKTLSEQKKEYEDYLKYRADWEPKCNKLYEENPDIEWDEVLNLIGDSLYPGPLNAYNPMRPCGLYKMMLSEVIKYSYAGVIFYQGESDDHKPHAYYNLFETLIDRWRKDNGDLNLPFIGVLLPMHRYKQDPDFKNWPVIRNNQRRVVKNKKGTALAVAIDLGEFNDIHPKHKKALSHRLFLQAACYVYKLISEYEANGPRISYVEFKENEAIATFDFSAGGFEVKGGKIKGFEVAENKFSYEDKDFVPAKATILNDKQIRVEAEGIKHPGALRYLYTNWGEVTLYGKNGLPVEPF